MAHRGTASTKKAEAVAPAFASVTAADIIRAPVVQKTIPLDLAALLVPYKRHGRLTVRVERMPQRAKLSAGRNNGDGSWSLASDELEDLNYLVPSSLCGGHELSVRIVSFDNATAHTLKVIPLAIPSWDNDADGALAENVVRTLAQTHDPILHNELSTMQSLFAVRDSDLAELRAALKQANAQKEAELAAARASWEAQLTQRLADAAALAKAEKERERLSWQMEQQGQAAHTEALIRERVAQEVGRAKAEADRQLEAERRHWQAQAEQRVAEEHSRLKVQTDQQLEAERKHWQALAEQRVADERIESGYQLDAERKHWQALTEQKVAEEHIRGKAEADQRVEAECQRWQVQANDSGAAERHRILTEADTRLAAEQKCWQDQAEQRIAAERQRWQSESDQRLEAERQRWANDSLAAASHAEARWKSEETVRASAALAEWQQQNARLLAEESDKCRKLEAALAAALTTAPAQPASAPIADTGGMEIERLRQELAALQTALPERDREISQLRDTLNQQRARQESEATQAAAAQALKSEEAARALVANARAESQDAIAAAMARAENAERMLAEAQGAPAAEVPRWDDGYVDGLRRDISTLRAALVNREVELGHARAALDQTRVQQVVQRPGNAPIRRFAGPDDQQEEASRDAKPTFVRDFAIMACILVPVILGYPYLASYLPDGVRAGIATATGGLLSVRIEPAPAPRPAPLPAPAVPRPTATVARTANVRDTPAAKGAVLVTLPRDAVVIVLQTSGNWTQVEIPATGGKPQQGWMFNTYLKSAVLGAKPANASAAVKPAVAVVKPERARVAVEPERASVAIKPENPTPIVKSENTSAAVEPESAAAEPAK